MTQPQENSNFAYRAQRRHGVISQLADASVRLTPEDIVADIVDTIIGGKNLINDFKAGAV